MGEIWVKISNFLSYWNDPSVKNIMKPKTQPRQRTFKMFIYKTIIYISNIWQEIKTKYAYELI